jgi:hypothetical protein
MRTGAGLIAGPIAGSIMPVFAGVLALSSSFAFAADPWADRVVEYNAGLNPAAGRTNPATALGEPTRFTGVAAGFPGAVTPFSPAFEADEIVSIGAGGSLTLAFDEPIIDDPANPFGIDLLVFGNSFVFDDINFTDLALVFSSDGGRIEVSADGADWREIIGVEADGLFPTLGYADTSSYFGAPAGIVPTDFTLPVDPSVNLIGLNFAQILAAYGGSGGGAGVDLASVGLSSASFVRFSLPAGATGNIEIDGVSDVRAIPAPASVLVITGGLFASMAASRRRRS